MTIEQLVEKGILSMQDTLYATSGAMEYSATLTRDDAGVVRILYNGVPYETPSRVAKDITNTNWNGWTFWSVRDEHGEPKGSLSDLRLKLDPD